MNRSEALHAQCSLPACPAVRLVQQRRVCKATACSESRNGSASRRQALVGGTVAAGVGVSRLLLPGPARAAEPLAQRMSLPPASLTSPGSPLFSKAAILEYPRWLFGTWSITAVYESFEAPLGNRFVDPSLLAAAQAPVEQGGIGFRTTYELRFFSTLPDTFENQLRVALGSLPEDAIVADRAFNTRSATNAFLGWEAVASVSYDPRVAPDRQTVEFSRLSPDMRPLPPKSAELYINNTSSEDASAPDGSTRRFLTSELCRQVVRATRSVDVTDYEILTDYVQDPAEPGRVHATQRTAIYLDPRQPLYFEAGNRAVALYTYSLQLEKVLTPDGAGGAISCVQTPKDVVQCV